MRDDKVGRRKVKTEMDWRSKRDDNVNVMLRTRIGIYE